jgi:hypothetical protein
MKKNPYKKYIEELDTMSDEQLLELLELESKVTNDYNKKHVDQEYVDSIDKMNKEQLKALKEAIIKFEQEDKNYQFVSKTNKPQVLAPGMFS